MLAIKLCAIVASEALASVRLDVILSDSNAPKLPPPGLQRPPAGQRKAGETLKQQRAQLARHTGVRRAICGAENCMALARVNRHAPGTRFQCQRVARPHSGSPTLTRASRDNREPACSSLIVIDGRATRLFEPRGSPGRSQTALTGRLGRRGSISLMTRRSPCLHNEQAGTP